MRLDAAKQFWVLCAFAVALACALCAPSLSSGLLLDDHVIRVFVQAHLAWGGPGALDMFHVYGRGGAAEIERLIDAGALPWWTLPELSIALFRPVAVATHYLDFWAWPRAPLLMHAQNLFWYGLLIVIVTSLYRRVNGAGLGATLALFFYAVDDAHAEGAAWIAGRNTLLAAVFAAATLLMHDRARRDGSRASALLAPCFLLCALASGEGAIAIWAYLGAYAWLLDRGPLRARVLSLVPAGAISLAWLGLYHALGYGTHGSGIYTDPLDAPGYFFSQRVPAVYPEVLREQFALPRFAFERYSWLKQPWLNAASVTLAVSSAAVWLVRARRDRVLRFWLVAYLGSALPLCTITVAPRLLFLSSIAGFALVAELVSSAFGGARRGFARVGLGLLGAHFIALHGLLAIVLAPQAKETVVGYERVIRSSAAHVAAHGVADTAYVLNTPNYFMTSLAPLYAPAGAWPARMHVLGASTGAVRVTRVSENAIVLEPHDGYLRELTSQVPRSPAYAFARGQRLHAGELRVTIDEVTRDGRPARVRFERADLSQPQLVWLAWRGDRYARVELPAVGTSAWLPGK